MLGGRLRGLTFDYARRELHALESRAGAAVVHTFAWDPATCLVPTGRCTVGAIPSAGHVAGGIAYDASNDALHVVVSSPSGPPNSELLSWPRAAGCRTQCRTSLSGCALGAVQALAFDPRSDTLYASDGRTVASFRLPGLCQTPLPLGCCSAGHPAGNTWAGFDVVLCTSLGSAAPFGPPGCPGTNGAPPVHEVTHGNGSCGPLQGAPVVYSLRNARPSALGVMHFGLDATSWNGIPLPLDLSFIGMPGCYLSHEILVSVGVFADPAGSASLSFTFGVAPVVAGVPIYTTIAVVDFGANAISVVHSNAMRVTLGVP
ncbi:MAG: hypothetical protein IPM29_05995 [Planctomycetes bacterium]|nr:hypothetical protein [Planctomycetota bacterium]